MRTVPMVGLVLVASTTVALACGGGGEGSLGKIQTPDGQYSVTKVELGDRLPLDCSGSDCLVGPPDCTSCTGDILDEGYQAVAVWVKAEFEGPGGALDDLCLQEEGIYIVPDGGTRSACISSISYARTEEQTLAFITPSSAEEFTLYVPGNPPIDLGK